MKAAVPVWLVLLLTQAITGVPLVEAAPLIVYSNYGPGNTFDTSWGWGILGSATTSGYRAQAQRFTPSITANLSTIELSIFRSQGSGLSNVSLVQDAGGFPTGSLLESFSAVAASGTSSPRLLNSAAHPLLQAGITYWLRLEPYDTTTVAGWYANNQGAANGFGYAFSPGAWNVLEPPVPAEGVFRVTAVPVPEPSSAALAAMAGLLVFVRSSRRGAGTR